MTVWLWPVLSLPKHPVLSRQVKKEFEPRLCWMLVRHWEKKFLNYGEENVCLIMIMFTSWRASSAPSSPVSPPSPPAPSPSGSPPSPGLNSSSYSLNFFSDLLHFQLSLRTVGRPLLKEPPPFLQDVVVLLLSQPLLVAQSDNTEIYQSNMLLVSPPVLLRLSPGSLLLMLQPLPLPLHLVLRLLLHHHPLHLLLPLRIAKLAFGKDCKNAIANLQGNDPFWVFNLNSIQLFQLWKACNHKVPVAFILRQEEKSTKSTKFYLLRFKVSYFQGSF